MSFSADGIAANLQAAFEQEGLERFASFVLRHARAKRWMIASDFNLGSPGAAHNVFAFAAYPTGERGYHEIVARLTAVIPADFKRTRKISSGIKRFFDGDDCFCFVILMPSKRLSFNGQDDHDGNCREARELVQEMLGACLAGTLDAETLRDIRRFAQETGKRNLSLALLDQILMFTVANAFVSFNVASLSGAEHLGWFPDRDNMTTYANSAWSSLAHLSFVGFWRQRLSGANPKVGVMDHRVRGNNDAYDPLIRVPDFLAATFSRWHMERGRLSFPEGTSRAGGQRYKQIIRRWGADNKNLWVGRILRDDEGMVRCARISITKSRKRRPNGG